MAFSNNIPDIPRNKKDKEVKDVETVNNELVFDACNKSDRTLKYSEDLGINCKLQDEQFNNPVSDRRSFIGCCTSEDENHDYLDCPTLQTCHACSCRFPEFREKGSNHAEMIQCSPNEGKSAISSPSFQHVQCDSFAMGMTSNNESDLQFYSSSDDSSDVESFDEPKSLCFPSSCLGSKGGAKSRNMNNIKTVKVCQSNNDQNVQPDNETCISKSKAETNKVKLHGNIQKCKGKKQRESERIKLHGDSLKVTKKVPGSATCMSRYMHNPYNTCDNSIDNSKGFSSKRNMFIREYSKHHKEKPLSQLQVKGANSTKYDKDNPGFSNFQYFDEEQNLQQPQLEENKENSSFYCKNKLPAINMRRYDDIQNSQALPMSKKGDNTRSCCTDNLPSMGNLDEKQREQFLQKGDDSGYGEEKGDNSELSSRDILRLDNLYTCTNDIPDVDEIQAMLNYSPTGYMTSLAQLNLGPDYSSDSDELHSIEEGPVDRSQGSSSSGSGYNHALSYLSGSLKSRIAHRLNLSEEADRRNEDNDERQKEQESNKEQESKEEVTKGRQSLTSEALEDSRTFSDLLLDLQKVEMIDKVLLVETPSGCCDDEDELDTRQMAESDDGADDEFECECLYCMESRSGQRSSSRIHGDDLSPTRIIEDTDSFLGRRNLMDDTWLTDESDPEYDYRLNLLLPLEITIQEMEEVERMSEAVMMQMLTVFPDLLTEQAPPPATMATIEGLQIMPPLAAHISQCLSCPICLCVYEEMDSTITLTCQHVFHALCIQSWLKKSGTCPVCRFVLE